MIRSQTASPSPEVSPLPLKPRLEDAFDLVRPNAASSVGEFGNDCALLICSSRHRFNPKRNRDIAAGRRMTNGIRNQIENNLLERAPLPMYLDIGGDHPAIPMSDGGLILQEVE